MKSAIVLSKAAPLSVQQMKCLAEFRDKAPGISCFLVALDSLCLDDDKLFDRVIPLPLTQADLTAGNCLGAQLAFNEGASSVGFFQDISAIELGLSRKILTELEGGSYDVVVVRSGNALNDALYISKRAAFVVSFWLALSSELVEERLDIICELCRLSKRRLGVVREKIFGAIRPYEITGGRPSVLVSHSSSLARLIGIRVGEFSPPRSSPVNKVAVITPYYKEPDAELSRCLESVRTQTYSCDHFMISDGFPNHVVEGSSAIHLKLGVAHADNGNTPRYVGAMVALALGYDAVAYLDADNWYESNHIESLVRAQHLTRANAVCSLRNIYLPDGYKLSDCDEEDLNKSHVDTSCYLFTRDVEYLWHLFGQMPKDWGPVCDRVIFSAMQGNNIEWTSQRTLNFKSNYKRHFYRAGKPIPEKTHDISDELWEKMEVMESAYFDAVLSRIGRPIQLLHSPVEFEIAFSASKYF